MVVFISLDPLFFTENRTPVYFYNTFFGLCPLVPPPKKLNMNKGTCFRSYLSFWAFRAVSSSAVLRCFATSRSSSTAFSCPRGVDETSIKFVGSMFDRVERMYVGLGLGTLFSCGAPPYSPQTHMRTCDHSRATRSLTTHPYKACTGSIWVVVGSAVHFIQREVIVPIRMPHPVP